MPVPWANIKTGGPNSFCHLIGPQPARPKMGTTPLMIRVLMVLVTVVSVGSRVVEPLPENATFLQRQLGEVHITEGSVIVSTQFPVDSIIELNEQIIEEANRLNSSCIDTFLNSKSSSKNLTIEKKKCDDIFKKSPDLEQIYLLLKTIRSQLDTVRMIVTGNPDGMDRSREKRAIVAPIGKAMNFFWGTADEETINSMNSKILRERQRLDKVIQTQESTVLFLNNSLNELCTSLTNSRQEGLELQKNMSDMIIQMFEMNKRTDNINKYLRVMYLQLMNLERGNGKIIGFYQSLSNKWLDIGMIDTKQLKKQLLKVQKDELKTHQVIPFLETDMSKTLLLAVVTYKIEKNCINVHLNFPVIRSGSQYSLVQYISVPQRSGRAFQYVAHKHEFYVQNRTTRVSKWGVSQYRMDKTCHIVRDDFSSVYFCKPFTEFGDKLAPGEEDVTEPRLFSLDEPLVVRLDDVDREYLIIPPKNVTITVDSKGKLYNFTISNAAKLTLVNDAVISFENRTIKRSVVLVNPLLIPPVHVILTNLTKYLGMWNSDEESLSKPIHNMVDAVKANDPYANFSKGVEEDLGNIEIPKKTADEYPADQNPYDIRNMLRYIIPETMWEKLLLGGIVIFVVLAIISHRSKSGLSAWQYSKCLLLYIFVVTIVFTIEKLSSFFNFQNMFGKNS